MVGSWFYQNFINTYFFFIFALLSLLGLSALIIYLSGKSSKG